MPKEQILVGSVFALVCLIVACNARWMVEHSKIGRGLADRLSETAAIWIVRAVFAAWAVFGLLLAANVIRPVQW